MTDLVNQYVKIKKNKVLATITDIHPNRKGAKYYWLSFSNARYDGWYRLAEFEVA